MKFCDRAGLNYVLCSLFRVPIARFAAVQATVEEALQEIYRLGKSCHSYDSPSCELQKVCIIVSLSYYLLNVL